MTIAASLFCYKITYEDSPIYSYQGSENMINLEAMCLSSAVSILMINYFTYHVSLVHMTN